VDISILELEIVFISPDFVRWCLVAPWVPPFHVEEMGVIDSLTGKRGRYEI